MTQAHDPASIAEEPVQEATRLLEVASAEGIPVRVVGGVAVWMRAPSLRRVNPPREFHDIDLASSLRVKRQVVELLQALGYEPHHRFNTLAGDRLMFFDPVRERRIDVFLDRIEMCHTLVFADRLTREPLTLPVADLLLTKLQIVRLTERDVIDLAALLGDNPLGDGPEVDGHVETARIAEICCSDWGWWRTVTGNLDALQEMWSSRRIAGLDVDSARDRARDLRTLLETAPKSVRWRIRAAVGERVPWYQEPEEVG